MTFDNSKFSPSLIVKIVAFIKEVFDLDDKEAQRSFLSRLNSMCLDEDPLIMATCIGSIRDMGIIRRLNDIYE